MSAKGTSASRPARKKPSPEIQASSEIRQHYFSDQFVIISPGRKLRPDSFRDDKESHKSETRDSPPIELDQAVWQLPRTGDWAVKVVNNLFPALTLDNTRAYGKQEIVVETPHHNTEFSELPLEQIENVFQAYIQRKIALMKLPGIQYVSVFKNDGPEAGASLAHAHSQIFALPLIPPDLLREATDLEHYRSQNQTCAYCDAIIWELSQKVRIIFEDKHIIAVAPYASTYPLELWIMPRKHISNFAEFNADQRASVAVILKKAAAVLDHHKLSFNFFLQDSLTGYDHHFVLKVQPRTSIWAGLELSTGMIINTIPPEAAASWYRRDS